MIATMTPWLGACRAAVVELQAVLLAAVYYLCAHAGVLVVSVQSWSASVVASAAMTPLLAVIQGLLQREHPRCRPGTDTHALCTGLIRRQCVAPSSSNPVLARSTDGVISRLASAAAHPPAVSSVRNCWCRLLQSSWRERQCPALIGAQRTGQAPRLTRRGGAQARAAAAAT